MEFLRATLKAVATIPSFPDTLPIGVAIRTTDGGIESDLVVPFEVSKTIADFVSAMTGQRAPLRQ